MPIAIQDRCQYCGLYGFEHTEGCNARTQALEAIRNPQDIRYDILDPDFLHFMARIADYGAKKYGEYN